MRENQAIWFEAPGVVSVRTVKSCPLKPTEYRIQGELSVVSSGTERLLLESAPGEQFPTDTGFGDESASSYPFPYGYQMVGRIIDQGDSVPEDLLGKKVFAFANHAYFNHVCRRQIVTIPENISSLQAGILANMETAVSLVWDLKPMFGEDIAIFGQGLLGHLVCRLLSQCGLRSLRVFDPNSDTHLASIKYGASSAESKCEEQDVVDRSIELSGCALGLESAIRATRSQGRIVCGSWYRDEVGVRLGTYFHRKRQELISSQVSTQNWSLGPHMNKERRLDLAMSQLIDLNLSPIKVERFTLDQAEQAYSQVRERVNHLIVFSYPQQ